MIIIAEKHKYDLVVQIILIVFSYASFFIGYKVFDSIEHALTLFTVVYCLKYVIELGMSYNFCRKG